MQTQLLVSRSPTHLTKKMELIMLTEPQADTKDNSLFAEITAEESAIVNGGRCRRRRRGAGITNSARNQVVFSGGRNFVVIYNL